MGIKKTYYRITERTWSGVMKDVKELVNRIITNRTYFMNAQISACDQCQRVKIEIQVTRLCRTPPNTRPIALGTTLE